MAHKLHHSDHTPTHPEPEFATRREFLSSPISAAVLVPWAFGQNQTPTDMAERFRQWSEKFEQEGLAAPFREITTDWDVIPGLFKISPSGVSWGWQLSGHHAIINYFVLGDQVVMASLFLGSEPVRATSGKYSRFFRGLRS